MFKSLIKQSYRSIFDNKWFNRFILPNGSLRHFSINNDMNCRIEPDLKYFIQQETKTLNNPFIMNWDNEPFIDTKSLFATNDDKGKVNI